MNIPEPECPVPIEQRPINEYNSLKESIFFFWTTTSFFSYMKTTLVYSILIYIITNLLVNASISNSESKVNSVLYSTAFGSFVLTLFFLRIYLGWVYVYERLIKSTVTYEESGWYDGQTWIKSPENLIQDKLIAQYQLSSILTRLKASLAFFASVFLSFYIYIASIK